MIFFLSKEIIGIMNSTYKPKSESISIKTQHITRHKTINKQGQVRYKYNRCIKYKSRLSTSELLLDCYQNINNKEGEYHKLLKIRRSEGKGVSIMASNESKHDTLITKTALDNLNPKQLMFFVLYNSPDYYDIRLNLHTYLDEVSAWLVTYLLSDKDYKKYGKICRIEKHQRRKTDVDGKSRIEKYQVLYIEDEEAIEFEGHNKEDVYGYISKTYSNSKGNFIFNDTSSFIEVKTKAKLALNSKQIVEAMKEMVSEILEDKENMIKQYYNRLDEIYKHTKDPKIRLECLKIGGKWLGMENVTINTNQNHVLKGLEALNAGIDFDIDEESFEVAE